MGKLYVIVLWNVCEELMGLVKTRRLAAMQKQQRAKAGMKPPMKGGAVKGVPHIPRSRSQ